MTHDQFLSETLNNIHEFCLVLNLKHIHDHDSALVQGRGTHLLPQRGAPPQSAYRWLPTRLPLVSGRDSPVTPLGGRPRPSSHPHGRV